MSNLLSIFILLLLYYITYLSKKKRNQQKTSHNNTQTFVQGRISASMHIVEVKYTNDRK